jgi:HEAT repeat protein
MGTEVEAFLGPLEAVVGWKDQLKSAVVFSLTPHLGLVPATGSLLRELRLRFETPAESDDKVAERWGSEASKSCTIVYFTQFEFGDQSDESATAWTGQQVVPHIATVDEALALLGSNAAIAGISRYGKTHLWAAAAVLLEFENRAGRAGILEALRYPSEYVRELAADRLRESGSQTDAAIPALIDVARNDPSYGARLRAATALGAMGSRGVPALMAVLAPGVSTDRWGAIFALGQMGPIASPAVPELVQILKTHPDGAQRRQAAESLGKMGEAAAAAIPSLIDALRDQDDHVRYRSVEALGCMGPSASQAIPALRQSLQDSYSELPWVAIVSLGQVGPFPLAEVVAVLRTNKNWGARCAAAKALGKRGREAQAAIPALIDALGDKDYSVRSNAAEALGLMGAAAREALPALRNSLQDRYVKIAATRSIEQIETDAT